MERSRTHIHIRVRIYKVILILGYSSTKYSCIIRKTLFVSSLCARSLSRYFCSGWGIEIDAYSYGRFFHT